MKKQSIHYLLFDNDGTLYPLEAPFRSIVVERMLSYLSQRLNLTEEEVSKERQRLFIKYDLKSTGYVFEKEYGVPFEELIEATMINLDLREYGIMPDNKLQKMLYQIKLPKSILTNNTSQMARKIIKALEVEDFFEQVIGVKEMEFNLKPHSRAFEIAFEKTGYEPKNTLFVDDTPEFLATAKKLGMTTVLMGAENCNLPYVDYCIQEIYDLAKVLKEHEKEIDKMRVREND